MTTINENVVQADLIKTAQRIYDLMDPWEREFSVEEIANDIKESPLLAIKWLLQRIEED